MLPIDGVRLGMKSLPYSSPLGGTRQVSSPSTPAPLPFWKNLVAGGIAGTTEILIMYPLDVVKTRFQLNSSRGSSSNLFATLKDMVKNEGFRMYRGILPPILAEAPKRAVKFSANESYKRLFNGGKTQGLAILAGVCAGLTEAVVVVPFEMVKIRLQATENKGKYKNTVDAVTKIAREEGIMAFSNGLEATLWRHGLWNGGYFGLIFSLKSMFPPADTAAGQTLINFVTGAIAGTFGTILNTPPDVVKTRIQNQVKIPGQPLKYSWTIPSMITVAKEEGVRALYKGFLPKVLRLGPGGGILLVVFQIVADILR